MVKKIIVAVENPDVSRKISDSLGPNYRVSAIQDLKEFNKALHHKKPVYAFVDLTFLDILAKEQGGSYRAVLERLRKDGDSCKVIVLSSKQRAGEAVTAVEEGASHYLTYPLDPVEISHVLQNIQKSINMVSELDYLRDRFWQSESLENIRTDNAQMRKVFELIRSVAPTKSTVLLNGETGTGKGLLAKITHAHSNRGENQFISVHCGAIPDTLLESELFGHEKGAFTGAIRKKRGKFEMAHGGTIFLDEVGTLTPSAQIKLLHVLQDGNFQRVGGEESIQVDVRVISATNVSLHDMCRDGSFRKDLFYRLNVFPIELPALRERKEDIPQLAELFLRRQEAKGQKGISTINNRVMEGLKNYDWPGNIRELENLIERAYILGNPPGLSEKDFPDEITGSNLEFSIGPVDMSRTLAEFRRKVVEEAEKSYLQGLLTQSVGKLKSAAETAGISTRQLHKLMKKYHLRKEGFKSTRRENEL